MTKRITTVGVFASLALILSYVEVLIPFNFGIPGVKLGLANLMVVTGIYFLKAKDVFVISMIRIFIAGLLFGSGVSLIYSLCGGLLSFFVMFAVRKTNLFSVVGVSVTGAVAHNIGQIIAAAFVMKSLSIGFYLPVLMLGGTITGFVLGLVCAKALLVMSGSGIIKHGL